MAHFGGRLSSARTPFANTNMQIEINVNEGDYYSIKKDGEDWPIVICDEEIIQTFFSRFVRPGNAKQADGTWNKDYKAGGFSMNDRHFPAIDLGTLNFMWAPLQELEPLDIDMGRAIRDSTANRLLAKAWMEYICQYKGDKIFEWKDLDHWKATLRAQLLNKIPPGVGKKERLPVGEMPEGRKRKGTPKFKYPPGYHNEELDDEESDDLFLPKENTAGPKIKRESYNSISSEEMNALYDDPDPTSSQPSKRSKLNLSGRFSMRPSTPLRAGPTRHGPPFQSREKKVDVNDTNTVMIYVDNPHRIFKVKRSGLDASPLLSKLIMHHPENGYYIMSPLLSSISADDFQPIGEYVDRREYHPNILDERTVHVRVEGDLSPEQLRFQVVRCGTVYQVAQMLEMPGLQDLAFRKLKALAPHYQARETLTVIDLLFEIGSPEIRQYFTRHVADHFWSLVLAETERMVQVLGANEDLAKGVFGTLSGQHIDDDVKAEAVVKEEGKDHVPPEKQGGGKVGEKDEEGTVGETNEGGKAEESHDEAKCNGTSEAGNDQNKDEGFRQPEEEMVRMALGRSEEGKNEDDWVQLVQKQSDLFEAF